METATRSCALTSGAVEAGSSSPIMGDGNLDGIVDEADYHWWASRFGDDTRLDRSASPANGDYDDNGVVDGLDYLVWVSQYNKDAPAIPSSFSNSDDDELTAVDNVLERHVAVGTTVADNTGTADLQLQLAIDQLFRKRDQKSK